MGKGVRASTRRRGRAVSLFVASWNASKADWFPVRENGGWVCGVRVRSGAPGAPLIKRGLKCPASRAACLCHMAASVISQTRTVVGSNSRERHVRDPQQPSALPSLPRAVQARRLSATSDERAFEQPFLPHPAQPPSPVTTRCCKSTRSWILRSPRTSRSRSSPVSSPSRDPGVN